MSARVTLRQAVALACLAASCGGRADEEDEDDDDYRPEWTYGTDATSDGTDATDGTSGGWSADSALEAFARASCDWVVACYSFEEMEVADYGECLEHERQRHRHHFSECELDAAPFEACLQSWRRATADCEQDLDCAPFSEICR